MSKKLVSILKYTASLLIAALLLFLAFKNVDFKEFWDKARTVDYSWVLISIVLSILAYVARAYRWNILLKPAGYTKLSLYRTTLAIIIGYLANLALPRLGEVTRCAMLNRTDKVPVPTALGTVIIERVIDVLTLLLLMLFTLIVEREILISFLEQVFESFIDLGGLKWKLIIGGGVLLFGVLGLYLLATLAGPKIKAFVKELYSGVISLKNIDNISGFVISTLVLWIVYYFMSYLIVFSLPETAGLGWMVGVMLLVTGGIALSLPVQAGFGAYHTLISVMLALYAVESTTGVFLATLLHSSQLIAVAVFGVFAVLILFVFDKSLGKTTEGNRNS